MHLAAGSLSGRIDSIERSVPHVKRSRFHPGSTPFHPWFHPSKTRILNKKNGWRGGMGWNIPRAHAREKDRIRVGKSLVDFCAWFHPDPRLSNDCVMFLGCR